MLSSADGNFEVSLATKATLYHTGLVEVKDKYEDTQNRNTWPLTMMMICSGSLQPSTTPPVRWTLSISPSTSRPASWSLEAGPMMASRWRWWWWWRWQWWWCVFDEKTCVMIQNIDMRLSQTLKMGNIGNTILEMIFGWALIGPSLWCTGVSLSPTRDWPPQTFLGNFQIFWKRKWG